MGRRIGSRGLQRWLVSATLVAFALRALIPAGFMPLSSESLTLEICPAGFPAKLLPHAARRPHGAAGHHSAPPAGAADGPTAPPGASLFGHCSFGAVPAPAPSPALSLLAAFVAATAAALSPPPVLLLGTSRHRLPQARAPPALS